jgi:2-C-methyl-D-erythritol 4-phosphate cytidylyltransferase
VTDEIDPNDVIDDVVAVVLAGGAGTRLGTSRPKAFVGLGGRVIAAWAVEAFEAHDAVDSIVLVVPDGWEEPASILVDDLGCDRVASIEVGGATRSASVAAALPAIPDRRGTAVLIHDAARPVVPADVVERVLAPLSRGFDAVAPVLPSTDTLLRVDDHGDVVDAPQREELRRAQTPQCIRASALHAAHAALDRSTLDGFTDDVSAVIANGGRACTVPGDERLVKITTSADLAALERQLSGGGDDD